MTLLMYSGLSEGSSPFIVSELWGGVVGRVRGYRR